MEEIFKHNYLAINQDKSTILLKSSREVSKYIELKNNTKISHTTINRRLNDEKYILIENIIIMKLYFT
jgi:hypothetical protein|tara:strand:+ start:280 stop:483 length:204 start_codon:yes stop_codon:yes gene_type:complete